VPPVAIRELRDLTRYRKGLIQERQREVNWSCPGSVDGELLSGWSPYHSGWG
jgi:hypothetical protein